MFTDIIGVLFLQPRKYMRYYFALIMHAFLVCKYLPETRGFYHPKWGVFIPQNGGFLSPIVETVLNSPFWGVLRPHFWTVRFGGFLSPKTETF